jgi:hypothetical protein
MGSWRGVQTQGQIYVNSKECVMQSEGTESKELIRIKRAIICEVVLGLVVCTLRLTLQMVSYCTL